MAQAPLLRRMVDAFRGTTGLTLDPGPLKAASPEVEGAAPTKGMQARAYDGFGGGLASAWLNALAVLDDKILTTGGSVGSLRLYDDLLDDDLTFSSWQQRRLALLAYPWDVEPGDDSPQAKEAADHLREQINGMGWDRICGLMHYGVWYGYAVGELLIDVGPDMKYRITDIIVPDRKGFAFTNAGELRQRTADNYDGEPVAPNKFWAYRSGATHDFAVYGQGLARWVYWAVWFKKNVWSFWSIFLEKFGQPTVVGILAKGESSKDRVDEMLTIAKAVGRDSAVVVNALDDAGKSPIGLAEAGRSASGASSYVDFISECNDAILRVILGQTMTAKAAAGGIGSNQSDTQKDVRDEIVKSDSDLLHESFNRGPARWMTTWNFGPDVASPRVYRRMEDEEDLNTVADRDVKLAGINIKRTEQSISEVYGEGYEYVEPEVPPALTPGAKPLLLTDQRAAKQAEFAAMDETPLYISRKVINANAIRKFFADQGVTGLVPASDMHVTIVCSKTPVDWFAMAGESWGDDDRLTIGGGGPRRVELFGKDAEHLALHFHSDRLKWRNESLIERGCSTDWPEYQQHMTLANDVTGIDVADLKPWVGQIVLGPEIYEAGKGDKDAAPVLPDVKFSAEELDSIDALAASLTTEADPVFAAMGQHIRDNLKGVKTPDGLRIALLEAIETLPVERLALLGGLPFTAARAAAAAGVEGDLVS